MSPEPSVAFGPNEASFRPQGTCHARTPALLEIPPPSLNQHSSSSSLGNSRSPSPADTNTPPSTLSSQLSGPSPQHDSSASIELSVLSVPCTSPIPAPLPASAPGNVSNQGQPPRSVPLEQANASANPIEGALNGADRSLGSSGRFWIQSRRWFSNSTNVTALLVSAIGLLFFGWRTLDWRSPAPSIHMFRIVSVNGKKSVTPSKL